MKAFALILFGLLFTLPSYAQFDFNKLFDKKKLKKSRSITYSYKRGYADWECLQGDCNNGQGIYNIKGNSFELLAKGTFKNGKLNGPATVYLFNSKARELATEEFKKELLKGSYTPKYFEKGVRCPDEIYEGVFTNNVLSEGSYSYYGTNLNRRWQYKKTRMHYLSALGVWKDRNSRSDKFLYSFTGDFTKSNILNEVILDLNTTNSKVEINTNTLKSIIKPSSKKGEFLCKKYKNNELVESKTLRGAEEKSYLFQAEPRVVEKRNPNERIKKHCYACNGKTEIKRRVWVIVERQHRPGGNKGYGSNVITKRSYATYTPGGLKPDVCCGTTTHLEDVMLPCSSCKGKGYNLEKRGKIH